MSQSNPTMRVSQRGAPICGADAANGRPVSSTTSSARTMRRPSVFRIDAAASGSTRASSPCSAVTPTSASRSSHRARTAGSVAGNDHSSSSAWMYIIDPPTITGTAPRAAMSSMSAAAAAWYFATVALSVTSRTSSWWWTMPRRSGTVSLAVPMSMPR